MNAIRWSMAGAGGTVVLLGSVPLLLVEYARNAGAVGTVNRAASWTSVGVTLVAFGFLAAMLMRRALSRAHAGGAVATAWVAAVPGLTIWFLGGLATPLLLALWNLRDEIRGLDGASLGVFGQWVVLLVLFGCLGAAASAGAYRWCNRAS